MNIDPADCGEMYKKFADLISPFLDNIRNIHFALATKPMPEMVAMLDEADRSHKQLYTLLKSHPKGAEVAGIVLLNMLGDRIGALRALAEAMATSNDRAADVDKFLLRAMADDPKSPTGD